MLKAIKYGVVMLLAVCSLESQAVPTLQVGAAAGPDDTGAYADYLTSLSNPVESDTAQTSSNNILFAGAYGPTTVSLGSATNYSDIDSILSVFDGHGAIVVASVADGSLDAAKASLTLDGNLAFHTSDTLGGLFPNSHDPLHDRVSDFLFFDIGSFDELIEIPDFASETPSNQLGEIKQVTLAGMDLLDWIHFDLMALEISEKGQYLKTTWENNPGSHDVTWKPPVIVSEPSVLALLGLGLLGMGMVRRRSLHE